MRPDSYIICTHHTKGLCVLTPMQVQVIHISDIYELEAYIIVTSTLHAYYKNN